MVAEVFAGLGALKTAFDIAKGLKDIDDATRRNTAVIELQEKILSAQQAQASLVETIGNLEKEVARLKDWEADKARYQLSELAPGLLALSVKEAMRSGEPFHRICADCAANGKKFYLQQHISGPYYDEFKCGGCGTQLPVNKGTPPSHPDDYEDEFISVRR
ncbi:hypothetical protein V1282_002451 [Nitrobacteraceae bacterium AZCC 2146]